MSASIIVVGSLSFDMVFRVTRRPGKGETVIGDSFQTFVGGKGNNQAMAAALAGASVAMVGRVGEDSYGDQLLATLEDRSVDTTYLRRDKSQGTGLANIYVDPDGDNSIVIVPRANHKLGREDIDQARPLIEKSDIVLLQLEIPVSATEYAARTFHDLGKKVILNPAPAPESGELSPDLLQCVDVLVPNQPETKLLTGIVADSVESALEAARMLKDRMAAGGTAVITMGEMGVVAVDGNNQEYVCPAFSVNAVDTTAAGDAFAGALAAKLSESPDLAEALRFACAAGALATTKAGAAPSLPSRQEIERLQTACIET